MKNPWVSATLLGFEPQAVAVNPTLGVTFELEFNEDSQGVQVSRESPEQKGLRLVVMSIDAALFYGLKDQIDQKGYLATGTVVPPFGISTVVEGDHYGQGTVVFPLTHQLVKRVEDLRLGGDAHFRVVMRVSGVLQHPAWGGTMFPLVLDRLFLQRTKRDSSPTLTVPKSEWGEKMLPALQYGKWQVYELPLGEIPPVKGVDEYIADAFAQYQSGNYKRAVSASRDATEALRDYIKQAVNPTFGDPKASAQEKVDRVSGTWSSLVESMLDFDGALTSLMAVGAHPRPAELTVTRYDAELALSIAASWRRYVALRLAGLHTG